MKTEVPVTALWRSVSRRLGGCIVILLLSLLLSDPTVASAAEFAHYPGAWYDEAQTRAQGAFSQERGITSIAVYATNDRLDRVDAFYRQFLYPLASTGAGRSTYCLDPVLETCRRFVELQDLSGTAGVGTRIVVIDRR